MKMLPTASVPTDTVYLNNKYTKWYYNLIYHARSRNEVSGYTEVHHIIPVCMYKYNNRSAKSQGFLLDNPNSADNLVVLTYREHLIAHWLLVKMVDRIWKFKMEAALSQFRFKRDQITSLEASRIKCAIIDRQKGLFWWNNGTTQILSDQCPNEEYTRGMIAKSSQGKVLWHNGYVNIMSKDCPGSEWKLGKAPGTNSSKGVKWWNNGSINVQSRTSPGDEWLPGRFKTTTQQDEISQKLKGVLWWYNGSTWTRAKKCPGPEWTYAKRSISKTAVRGRTFWHNGQIQKMSAESPGPGWVPGRIPNISACIGKPNVNKGRKLWNNGIQQKSSHECPGDGWYQGRLK